MKQNTYKLPLLAALAGALKKLPESAKELMSSPPPGVPVAPKRHPLNRAQRRRMAHNLRLQMKAEYARAKEQARRAATSRETG